MSDPGAPVNGRLARIRDCHFECYVDLAQTAVEEPDGEYWLGVFDAEHANIRTALEWGLATARGETARFAASLLWYWQSRQLYNEGRQILDRVLRVPDLLPLDRTDTLLAAGSLAATHSDPAAARDHYETARRLAVSLEDAARRARAAQGLGWSLYKLLLIGDAVDAFVEARELSASLSLEEQADVLRGLGWTRAYNEGAEISLELHREARFLLEEARHPALTAHYLVETNLLVGCGRVEEALALADKSVEFARATGRPLSRALAAKSNAASASGDRELLRQVLEEGIQVARVEKDATVEASLLRRRATDAVAAGEIDSAREAVESGLRLLEDTEALDFNAAAFRAELLVLRARLGDDAGEIDLAHELYRQAIAAYSRSSTHSHAEALVGLGRLYVERGDLDAARAVRSQAVALLERIDAQIGAIVRVDLAVLTDEVDEALRLTNEALEVERTRMPRDVPALLWRKASLLLELGRLDQAGAAVEELGATGLGGTTVLLERARIHIAGGKAEPARSDLSQLAGVLRLGWAAHQIQLATTLARLALLDGREQSALALWAAVQDYRTANQRIAPRLSRRFEEPLQQLTLPVNRGSIDSRPALDALRALVSDEFSALARQADD